MPVDNVLVLELGMLFIDMIAIVFLYSLSIFAQSIGRHIFGPLLGEKFHEMIYFSGPRHIVACIEELGTQAITDRLNFFPVMTI